MNKDILKHLKLATYILAALLLLLALHIYKSHYYYQQGLNQAINSASNFVESLNVSRVYYSQHAVNTVKKSDTGFQTGPDYLDDPLKIPNPATATIETCIELQKNKAGFIRCGLFSHWRFPVRDYATVIDEAFQEKALEQFTTEQKTYYEVSKQDDSMLYYAEAIFMEQSCVDCHNSHPLSPKKTWKVGDIRGGIGVAMQLNIRKNYSLEILFLVISLILLVLYVYIFLLKRRNTFLYKIATEDIDDTCLSNRQTFDDTWNQFYTNAAHSPDKGMFIIGIKLLNFEELRYAGDNSVIEQLKVMSKKLHMIPAFNTETISRYSPNTIAILCNKVLKEDAEASLQMIEKSLAPYLKEESIDADIHGIFFKPLTITNCQVIFQKLEQDHTSDSPRFTCL